MLPSMLEQDCLAPDYLEQDFLIIMQSIVCKLITCKINTCRIISRIFCTSVLDIVVVVNLLEIYALFKNFYVIVKMDYLY